MPSTTVRTAIIDDVPLLLALIRELAEFEKLSHEVVATEAQLRETLFGPRPAAEVLIGEVEGRPVGFALFFSSYSTFLAKPGLYLEDLYVQPAWRSRGLGRLLLGHMARIAIQRDYGRMEWSVLDWNEKAIRLYRSLGADPMSEWTVQRLSGKPLRALAE